MAHPDLGEGTRLAASTWAWIVVEDEAGATLRPTARTGTARASPVVAVSGTGGWISVAAPVCSRPGHRGRLCYPILVHRRRTGERRSFCEDHSAEPIAAAPVPLTAPIILKWDNLNGHRSFALRGFCNVHHDWLTVLLRAWFAPATTCELVWDERLYPPKAILGTAYEFATGRRLASGDFEGGKSGAVRVLGKLGFDVQHL